MTELGAGEARDDVPALLVLGRVCLGGLMWGPIGGTLFAALLIVGGAAGDPAAIVPALAFGLFVGVLYGAPVGVVVGVVAAPVAALVLLGCRRVTTDAPPFATLLTLAVLWVAATLPFGVVTGESAAFVLGVCCVAAWPMHRTLRVALRPAARSAEAPA